MPVQPFQIDRRNFHTVVADREHLLRAKDNWVYRAYFPVAGQAEYWIHAGLIVARSTSTATLGYYVPYNVSAAYGAGSDTAVGVLGEPVDISWNDEAIAPVVHGKLIEAYCYVQGGAVGTVPAAVKSALTQIEWV